ncbi:MAG: hypothetical protein OXH39_08625 [Candidatus Poribacteria bacterium]|nr:hypothetical protein [Candidatus Poribacteria bacterium]
MSKTSRIRDNNLYGTVANFLKDKIQDGASLSFVSAYFTINAFNALRDSLTGIDNLRFLFGEPDVVGGMDPSKTESKAFRLTEEGLGLRRELSQSEIAKACANKLKSCDNLKSIVQPIHGTAQKILKSANLRNTKESFMMDVLGPCIQPGMKVYEDLHKNIFCE